MELIIIALTIVVCMCFALGYKDRETMAKLQVDLYEYPWPVVDNDPTIIPESLENKLYGPATQEELTRWFTEDEPMNCCPLCGESSQSCKCTLTDFLGSPQKPENQEGWIGQELEFDLLIPYTNEVVGMAGETYSEEMHKRHRELMLEADRLQGYTICTTCHQSELECTCNQCQGCGNNWDVCTCTPVGFYHTQHNDIFTVEDAYGDSEGWNS